MERLLLLPQHPTWLECLVLLDQVGRCVASGEVYVALAKLSHEESTLCLFKDVSVCPEESMSDDSLVTGD